MLRNKWRTVNLYLSSGNITPALTHFTSPVRTKYQAVFDEVSTLLPTILGTYQGLTSIVFDDELAKYKLTTLEGTELHAYDVVFEKDDDGIWRIRSY